MAIVVTAALATAWPVMAQGQVYKWTDAQGRTHYSERKPERVEAPSAELKLPPLPPAPSPSPARVVVVPASQSLPAPVLPEPRRSSVPRALSDGRDHGTDASRCALARDVLSGAVVHSNGLKTDQNDRDIANNDIKRFCR